MTGDMRVTKETSGRVTHQLGGGLGVAVGRVATGIEFFLTKETFAAGNREGHDDAISDLEIFHTLPDFDHFAHRFVAKNVALLHRWHVAIKQVQV